jgi:hypothetical protein
MHSEMRGIALLLLVFFAGDLHALKADAQSPASDEQLQVFRAAQPQNQAKPTGSKPEASPATPQEVAPNKPASANNGDFGATLANLPVANRLAISIGAGMFTLVLALWIGARRD